MTAYEAFLREKIAAAPCTGFDVPLEEMNPALKPHTRDIVRWMLKGGSRACFASFGLHKMGTVGVRAIKLGRRARGSELSASYFADQVHYLRAAEREMSMPTLFDLEAA